MSSPLNSQADTPTTTPPAAVSNSATPTAEPEQRPEEQAPENNAMDVDEEVESSSLTLPLSKIKRIFKMDADYAGASQSAVFATGVATELFIQYFAEQAAVMAKLDNRKKITYKDFSTVVSTQDALHFLADTVPKTVPLSTVLQKKQQEESPEETEQVEVPPREAKRDIKNMLPISKPPAVIDPPKKSLITDLMDSPRDSGTETPEADVH